MKRRSKILRGQNGDGFVFVGEVGEEEDAVDGRRRCERRKNHLCLPAVYVEEDEDEGVLSEIGRKKTVLKVRLSWR